MSFVVTSPATPAAEPPIDPGPFWPEVDPAKIREAQRIDGTVTAERLNAALIEAIASVNGELAAWRETQQAAGAATLADVDAAQINDVSIHVHRYLRAVGCLAKAGLTERHPDFDATGKGERKADALEGTIDDLRRDARWAIADILGVRRTTVELI
ncbi:MAG: head completion/stabilization protein [Denitratisoma sp.]|nr:head completion/stabilization protein [Denitratisoma sp.]